MFENRVLRKIFGPTWGDVTEDWTRPQNEELCDMYCSPNIIGLVKPRRIWWARCVARMGDRRGALKDLMGGVREGDKLEYLGIDGRMILKWAKRKWDGGLEWIAVAQDRNRHRALVNADMNVGFHKMWEIS